MYRYYCRGFQTVMRGASYLMPWKKPGLLQGIGVLDKLPARMQHAGFGHALLVTDEGITRLGLYKGLLDGLAEVGILCEVYDKTVANPTIANVEEAFSIYWEKSCDCIIMFGGGSAMDCAKGVGMRAARPGTGIHKMRGILRVLRQLPPLIAVPTTAGTGSEVTLAAVITDAATHDKFAVMDPVLAPGFVVLDAALTKGLPPSVTAETGMDTLTHAVEAYIGRSNTRDTEREAIHAVRLVFGNLRTVYFHGEDMEARAKMQTAAMKGGLAFTRAYVGYVHAVAHSLGGQYGVPHGLANAVVLPYVLEKFGPAVYGRLADLADAVDLCPPYRREAEKALAFITAIRNLNRGLGIPDKIEALQAKDIPSLAAHARKEGNPLYPVPVIWNQEDFEEIYRKILVDDSVND